MNGTGSGEPVPVGTPPGGEWTPAELEEAEFLVARALAEDVGNGDWTTIWTVDAEASARAEVVAKEALVLAGTGPARMAFLGLDPSLEVEVPVPEGTLVETGGVVMRLRGSARGILTGERTALNFLGRLSGIATLTRQFVDRVDGTGARIVDTRKTTPGWRHLEKQAVRTGGGSNHRVGLYDMVLIKDNHIAAVGSVGAATRRVRDLNTRGLPVEVEVVRPEQVEELRGLSVDRILLDNMAEDGLREAVRRVHGWTEPRPLLEASGNMTLERVRSVAETGVDLISVGALTHSVRTVDLSLRLIGSAVEPRLGNRVEG
jgi:nicotinate-nucleotide pyrophosphorylase (carboxylating)